MERREFIIGLGAALFVPAAIAAVSGCSSSSTDSTPTDSFEVISSSATSGGGYAAHTHVLAVRLVDLANPPAAGVTYTTSTDDGHTHQVVLSNADLAGIQAGQTISESTNVVLGHEHTFAIRKP